VTRPSPNSVVFGYSRKMMPHNSSFRREEVYYAEYDRARADGDRVIPLHKTPTTAGDMAATANICPRVMTSRVAEPGPQPSNVRPSV
jgi:hypothetical protein